MKISYSVKDDKIVSANNQANSGYSNWLANNEHLEIIEVDTEDTQFTNTSNLKVVDGAIVINEEKIAQEAKEALRSQYKTERDEALYSATIELDGMVFQTRPSDMTNFTVGISKGSTEWVLADNSVATVTIAQLQSVLDSAQDQAKSIFDDYMTNLKSL